MSADEAIESKQKTAAIRTAVGEDRPCETVLLGSPREILARIVPNDPLELRRRLAMRLRERALLFDFERVLLRVFALVAYRALAWRGRPELERWIAARIDEAIEDALDERDSGAGARAREPRPTPSERRDAFALLAAPLGLDARELRGACARFNRLSASEREAFFLLVIEGEPLDAACAKRAVPAHELARAARRALDVLRDPAADAAQRSGERPRST